MALSFLLEIGTDHFTKGGKTPFSIKKNIKFSTYIRSFELVYS